VGQPERGQKMRLWHWFIYSSGHVPYHIFSIVLSFITAWPTGPKVWQKLERPKRGKTPDKLTSEQRGGQVTVFKKKGGGW